MKSLRFLNLLLGIAFSLAAATSARGQTTQPPPQPASPVPFIDILAPTSTYPGHGDFVLSISGANFQSGATVQFDGLTLIPITVTRNALIVIVPAVGVASAHTASITVRNPNFNPFDLIKSNVVFFPITNQTAGLGWAQGNAPTIINSPVGPASLIAVADFNGDGHQDVVVTSNSPAGPNKGIAVYLGDGMGNFTLAPGSPFGPASNSASGQGFEVGLEAGDFNNDGKMDIAYFDDSGLSIFLGNGDGTMSLWKTYAPGALGITLGAGTSNCIVSLDNYRFQFAVGDVNGDGVLDLVFPAFNTVQVLLGDGNGNFVPSSSIDPFLFETIDHVGGVCRVALGDFNGDGWLDIAASVAGMATPSQVALNNGLGGFNLGFLLETFAAPSGLAAGDMNGDGFLDLIGSITGVDVFLNQPSDFAEYGPFPPVPGANEYLEVAQGDLTGAGSLDVVASVETPFLGGFLQPLIGNNAGNLYSNPTLVGPLTQPTNLRLADFNEDGRLDIVMAEFRGTGGNGDSVVFGEWLQIPGAPIWSVVQPSFGTVVLHLGQMSGNQPQLLTETLSNSGPGPLDIANICSRNPGPVGTGTASTVAGSNPCLTGTDSLNFPISAAASTCPLAGATPGTNAGTIQPGGNCTVAVGFQPTTFGAFSATLSVVDDANGVPGSVQNVTLTGTAIELDANVQSPINADGSSVFSSQRGVVPVKFTLQENFVTKQPGPSGCQLPPATIGILRTAGGTVGPVDTDLFEMAADSGANFRIDTTACQYVYNVDARSLGPGTYNVQIFVNPADLGGKEPGPTGIGSANFGLN